MCSSVNKPCINSMEDHRISWLKTILMEGGLTIEQKKYIMDKIYEHKKSINKN